MSLPRNLQQSLKEAKDPKTLSARLVELAEKEDQELLREIAKNPSTPLETLLRLALHHPEEFLANPALPLFFLKNPNVLHKLTRYVAEALFGAKTLPSFALQSLATHPHPQVRRRVGKHPNTALAFLEVLSRSKDKNIRQGVAENPNAPVHCLKILTKDEDVYVRRGVAQNPNTPLAFLKLLSRSKDSYVRQGVALNPNTPVAWLEVLTKDKNIYVRRGVAQNPNTPLDYLEILSLDQNIVVRRNTKDALKYRKE